MFAFKKMALAGSALSMIAAVVPAHAQEKTGNKTLGSGNDIWRIELRNLESFFAMSVGDSDNVGELYYIDISLSGPDGQFHKVREVNPFISINNGPRSLKNTLNVSPGDRVNLERLDPETTNTYDLWVHAKERQQGDLGVSLLNFEIKVEARELDCAKDRVCDRGSTGTTTYSISLPIPSVRQGTCNVQNSYQISASNGDQMSLQPRNARSPRGRIRARSQSSNQHSAGLIAQGSSDAMRLAMHSGEVCIAWTGRQP
jgi:hypothetical protein